MIERVPSVPLIQNQEQVSQEQIVETYAQLFGSHSELLGLGFAERHRAEGRFRDALRCRYRALVGDLARRGLLDEIPGCTTGEERRQLRVTSPNAVPFFGEAADIFDGAWYGNVSVDASDDDRFRQLDRDVLANSTSMPHRVPRSYLARLAERADG